MDIDREWLKGVIAEALSEDIGEGDLTTDLVIDKGLFAEAEIISHEEGILAGLEVAEGVFLELDYDIGFIKMAEDGNKILTNQVVALIKGKASSILSAERTALNFLSYLSGIATLTNNFVKISARYGVKIYDTRKTTPLLRPLERYAVRMGGGNNHRGALDAGIIIKDNHLRIIDLASAVKKVRDKKVGMRIEVETKDLDQVREAIKAQAEIIMLDNMEIDELKKAVGLIRSESPSTIIEVSGGITLQNIEEVARFGPDMISIGALTHSPKILNFSLEIRDCF